MLYRLEQRIHTLAENVVDRATGGDPAFTAEGITFSPWKVEPSDGYWAHQYWLATSEIEEKNFQDAWRLLWNRLARIVPRVCFVSQCYIEYVTQPLLIVQKDFDTAFLRYTVEKNGVGLMFMDQEHKALDLLLNESRIPMSSFGTGTMPPTRPAIHPNWS
jgi:hypothetical protein